MNYDRLEHVDRDQWLLGQCAGETVLHVGCTDKPLTQARVASRSLLHAKIVDVSRGAVGLDVDAHGIETRRSLMPSCEFVAWDAERLHQCSELGERTFDVVLAADVLEHLSNPGNFLSGASSFLNTEGVLIATTPHVADEIALVARSRSDGTRTLAYL